MNVKNIIEFQDFEDNVKKYFDLMLKSFEGESDRSVGIVSVCIIDEQLEILIRSCLINNKSVNSLFKSEQLLKTFFAKTNIAYYFGIIPKWLYDDLRVVGKIRNHFAHEITSNPHFNEPYVINQINQCRLRLKILDGILGDPSTKMHLLMAKTQYILIVSRISTYLSMFEHIILKSGIPKPIDVFTIDETEIDKHALTKNEFLKAISNESVDS